MVNDIGSWLAGALVLTSFCPSLLVLPVQFAFAKKLLVRVGPVRYWSSIGLHLANGLTLWTAIAYLGKQCLGCVSGVMLFLGIPLWWSLFMVGLLLSLVPRRKRNGEAGPQQAA
ncbi:hypothetical protein E2F46_13010 [Luteimonas aestuarii]|uniref:Uncharacterized protein n=1 Tax=Luteimonas aestuarii TaxID=453837 RepID=A0A4R5TLV0_9GAMM|nr:hypothetical protein [Luteimonas aestuarii]TDK22681.1 hypothetical protein E2F46_13010 [Luteimonas aestuarii]